MTDNKVLVQESELPYQKPQVSELGKVTEITQASAVISCVCDSGSGCVNVYS